MGPTRRVAQQQQALGWGGGQGGCVLGAHRAAGQQRRHHRRQPQVRLAHLAVHVRGVRVAAVTADGACKRKAWP